MRVKLNGCFASMQYWVIIPYSGTILEERDAHRPSDKFLDVADLI